MAAKTVTSGSDPYITAAEFIKRFDKRLTGDLVSITGARDLDGLATNDVFLACMKDASGFLEAICTRGMRYTPADLAALYGTACNAQGYLFRVMTWLTIWFVWQHRDSDTPIPEQVAQDIERLADGEHVFGFLETQEAGLPAHHVENATEITQRQGMVVQAERLYGRRSNRSDPERQ